MKTKIYLLLLVFTFFAIFSGCKIEGCTDDSAWNFDPDATDDDGSCVYITLQSGSWTANEACTSGNYQYTMTLNVSHPDITIVNFGNYNITVNGTLNDGNISIPDQQTTMQGIQVAISGITGTYTTGSFSISYTISGGGVTENCTITGHQ